jgi:hypothetical protein
MPVKHFPDSQGIDESEEGSVPEIRAHFAASQNYVELGHNFANGQ